MYFYHPCSEASEGYVFTGVCHLNSGGEWTTPKVNHLPPGQGQRSTTSPLDRNTTPLDRTPTHPQEGEVIDLPPPPPPNIRALCSGWRYASYWNAFLLYNLAEQFCPNDLTVSDPGLGCVCLLAIGKVIHYLELKGCSFTCQNYNTTQRADVI